MRYATDVRRRGAPGRIRARTPVRVVVLAAAVLAALALPGSRSWAGQDVQPSPQAPEIPSFEEVKERMVAAFRACDSLNLHAGGKTVVIRARAQGREGWEMMTRAVEEATPGWVLGRDPEVSIDADSGEPEWDWFVFSYTEPILGSDRPEYGGNRRTLKVGPEFAEGLDRLYEAAGADVRPAGERGGRRWRRAVPISVGTPPEEAVPAERAIAEAKRVAEGIDVPFGEGAVATWRDARGIQRPRWEVEFKEFSAISVSPSGRVTGAINSSALWFVNQPEGGEEVPKAEAVRIARHAVEVIGMLDDLSFQGAEMVERMVGNPEWEVRWQRVWRGVPYEQSFDVVVEIDAATGTITSIGFPESAPPPASTEVKVSKDEAEAIALNHVAGQGVRLVRPEVSSKLHIEQPRFDWTGPGQPEARYDDPTRVVWRVEVTQGLTPGEARDRRLPAVAVGVQVDAESGKVVGDVLGSTGPPSEPPSA